MLSIIGLFICQQKHNEEENLNQVLFPDEAGLKSLGRMTGYGNLARVSTAGGVASVFHAELIINFFENGFRCISDLLLQAFEFVNHFHCLGCQVGMTACGPAFVTFQQGFAKPFFHFPQPAPHGSVSHPQGFGCRIDGPLIPDGFQDMHLSFPENGISGLTLDPDLNP